MFRATETKTFVPKEDVDKLRAKLINLVSRGLQSQDYDEAISTFYKMRDILDGISDG